MGARAEHYINLERFGYIAGLSQWGRRGVFFSFKLCIPAFAALRGGGGQHPVKKAPNLSQI
jgi:hypothetical protein